MRVFLLLLGALVTAECQRAPAEDFAPRLPASTVAPGPSGGSGASAGSAGPAGSGGAEAPPLVSPSVVGFATATASAGMAQAPTAVPQGTPSAASQDGRCILPTPADPPPPVAPGPAPGCPPDPDKSPPHPPTGRVTFPGAASRNVSVEAELVSSPQDTERGLMYRKSMPEDHGMLFDLRDRSDHAFWMHNTCIPLDLLYADEDGLIVGIVENAPTLNDGVLRVGCPNRYVLEVNAGWCRRHGVKAGQPMKFPKF